MSAGGSREHLPFCGSQHDDHFCISSGHVDAKSSGTLKSIQIAAISSIALRVDECYVGILARYEGRSQRRTSRTLQIAERNP